MEGEQVLHMQLIACIGGDDRASPSLDPFIGINRCLIQAKFERYHDIHLGGLLLINCPGLEAPFNQRSSNGLGKLRMVAVQDGDLIDPTIGVHPEAGPGRSHDPCPAQSCRISWLGVVLWHHHSLRPARPRQTQ